MAGVRLRRRPRQARSQEKVARVLAAAERLLGEEGVSALTTTRVAAEAGVSVGALYQYLPDRDAIVEALAEQYLGRLEAAMSTFAQRAAEEVWDDPVGVLVDAFAELYRSQPGFRALWFSRDLTDGTRDADRRHKHTMSAGLHTVLVAQHLLPPTPEAATACRTAFLAADAVTQEAFRGDGEGDAALLAQLKVLLRAYLGRLGE
ncbi:TetR/AcrR family transcriptional regulator [Streptomyces roseirectus]|uniref:TetR/AcrR family transcriptional regulator n=1 Tax=Streptomyces roseirectus TaxID=2768066 RepID=A0A7H0ISA9_9ACTN|nr:TetR/AcrR family transcriptional regulator [Streptomyces roseirectus]